MIRRALPPFAWDAGRAVARSLGTSEWEYIPGGWDEGARRARGWNVESVADAERSRWNEFLGSIQGSGPLGIAHESSRLAPADTTGHHTVMCYGYALARAARGRERMSILDWGGGIGHYSPLSRALLPEVEIEYHCHDLPAMCRRGRELLPEAHFHEDEAETFARRYDLVLASSSLQYAREWRATAARLAGAARGFLLVTRLPVVHRARSFVVLQRAHRYGYDTEYVGWFLNRGELIDHVTGLGMELERELLIDERPYVHRAPEPCEYRGFLFRPSGSEARA